MSLSPESLDAARERLAVCSTNPEALTQLQAHPREAFAEILGDSVVADVSDAELAQLAEQLRRITDQDRASQELDENQLEQVVGGGMSFTPGKFFSQFLHGFFGALGNGEGLIGAWKAGTDKIGKDATYAEPFFKS